jgi:hypothetical protein
MIIKVRIPRFASSGGSLASTKLAMQPVRAGSTFHAALTDSAEDWVMRETPRAMFTPRPETPVVPQAGLGLLARAWDMLRTKYVQTTTKRLRVAETVSLGEKRFVSIVCVEGREFLVGGGTSGVSLLAQLTPGEGLGSLGYTSIRGDAR